MDKEQAQLKKVGIPNLNHYIIKKTVLSDKTVRDGDASNKYTFVVDKKATKGALKECFDLMGLEVTKIRVLKVAGKKKTAKGKKGYRKSKKKAIVTFSKKSYDRLGFYST